MSDYDLTNEAGKALSVLDEVALREITEAAGMMPMELIDMFIDDAASTLVAMDAALAANDRETFNRLAHTFKSSAGNVGAERIAAISREMERLTKLAMNDQSTSLLRQLTGEVARFRQLVTENHASLSQ